jgi:hypothetical protein
VPKRQSYVLCFQRISGICFLPLMISFNNLVLISSENVNNLDT